MSTRTVALWESAYDNTLLNKNEFNFCIAKSVIDKTGQPIFNVVWQSKAPRPRATISWQVQYGLNWSTGVPDGSNAQVTVGGAWQACNPGESFDLTSDGLWAPSAPGTGNPRPGFLNVGKNYCQYPGQTGINILVGVLNSAGDDYDTPQEKAQWWYEMGAASNSMISGAITNVCQYDLTSPDSTTGEYYVSTTYVYSTGVWSTASTKPPGLQSLTQMAAPPSNTEHTDQLSQEIKALAAAIRALAQAEDGKKGGSQVQVGSGVDFIFTGTLNWPVTVAIAVVVLGLNLIIKTLTANGKYEVTLSETVDGDQRKRSLTFRTTTPPKAAFADEVALGVVPQSIISDWNAAVQADAKDGVINKGVK